MKSIRFSRFGGPEVLELVHQPVPELTHGQVLVRMRASGVNLADSLMRENRYAVTPALPAVPGFEVAGTVERVADDVTEIQPGARVAVPLFAAGAISGGYQEFVAVDAGIVVPLPDSVSFETATALMMQGLTAHYLVREIPPAGKTILVNAAAGGVGSMLVQLARQAGAKRVIAGASSEQKLAVARGLGATAGVDYTAPDWVQRLLQETDGAGPDIVYESVGGNVTRESLAALAPRGNLVIYGALNIQEFQLGVPELVQLIFKNQRLTGFALPTLLTLEGLKAALNSLFALAQRGELAATIGGRFPLERAAEAHALIAARRTTGKLVLVA
jgi:NADPH2:quinone reductase